MTWLATLGRLCFALALVGSGALQLLRAVFVRLVPPLPPWVPAPGLLACLSGAVLVVAGGAILTGKMARRASAVVGALLLVLFTLLHVPKLASAPMSGFMWTNPCKVLALLGGAILLAGGRPGIQAGRSSEIVEPLARLRFLGPIVLGGFLLVCGLQHFAYAEFVDALVPAWIPPGARFWTRFTGVALIAGGLGILIPRTTLWAAVGSGLIIFLWIPLLHIPRAVSSWPQPGEAAGIFEALALAGVAFLVAGRARSKVDGLP